MGFQTHNKKPEQIRLALGVPSGEHWHKRFGQSLAVMMTHLCQMILPRGPESWVALMNEGGSILPQLRHKIVLEALDRDATHLLFLDSDQSFPPDIFTRLYRRNVDVVACNVAVKCFPSHPTARQKGGGPNGIEVFTTEHSRGLEKVWRVGTGVMLVKMDVFRRIQPPWFMNEYLPFEIEGQTVWNYGGEDWYFCKLLEQAKIPIFIDHEASWLVGHHGSIEFDHKLIVPDQRAKEAS